MKKQDLVKLIKECHKEILKEERDEIITDIHDIENVKTKFPKAYKFFVDVYISADFEEVMITLDDLLHGDEIKLSKANEALGDLERML